MPGSPRHRSQIEGALTDLRQSGKQGFDSLPWVEGRDFILPEVDAPVFIAPASSVLVDTEALDVVRAVAASGVSAGSKKNCAEVKSY